MFRKLKKTITLLLASAMMISIVLIPSSAIDGDQNVLHILTDVIPDSVTNFARGEFSKLRLSELLYMGFAYDEVTNLRLTPGFTAEEYDACDSMVYYFPITNNEGFIALMLVVDDEGQLYPQFSKSQLTDSLNRISANKNTPMKVVVANNAIYAVSDNGTMILESNPSPDVINNGEYEISKDRIKVVDRIFDTVDSLGVSSQTSQFTPMLENFLFDSSDKTIVALGRDSAFTDTIIWDAISPFANIGKMRSVPFVNNLIMDDEGTCWASCVGSIMGYYYGYSSTNALRLRDIILSDRKKETGGYAAGASYAKELLDFEFSTTLTVGGKLSWNQVKTQINTYDSPCYTAWARTGGRHALVLCGYFYDENNPNTTSSHYMYVMDPNKTSYVKIYYNSTYTTGTRTYAWDKSVHGKY